MSTVQKSVIDEDEIDTVLEADIQFSGTLETSKSLLVKGKISGVITCRDDLYIAKGAIVDAEIRAVRVTVRGKLKGSVLASESIQLMAESHVEATLEAPDIVIEKEEHFKGTATITGIQENA